MSGFKVKRKVYKLVFKDPEYEGLEVLAHSLNTGQYFELAQARAKRAAGGVEAEVALQDMLQILASALVSWNAEDEDDQPIPATLEGLNSQEPEFGARIIEAWNNAISGVSAPLSETSNGGEPSVEASIPMDVPSSSPES